MVDDHLIFLVTIPIYNGSNESSEKDVFGSGTSSGTNPKSSERSSETTAISSGTVWEFTLIRFLDKPSGKDEHGDIHTTEIKRKTYKNSI